MKSNKQSSFQTKVRRINRRERRSAGHEVRRRSVELVLRHLDGELTREEFESALTQLEYELLPLFKVNSHAVVTALL